MSIAYNHNFQIHPKKKIIIIWQAKAACTIVNKMYYEQEGLLDKALKSHRWIHRYRKKHNSQIENIRKIAIKNIKNKYIQFIVNPYRRAASSYIHAMKKKKYRKLLCLNNENISFEEFINILIKGKIKPNIHHNKQTFYLHKSRKIEYIKMEEIEKKLPIINKKYGLNYKLHTSSHHVKKNSVNNNNFIGQEPWNNIKDNIPEKYHNFYNKDIRKKVEKLYAEDIKNFGYTWDMFVNNKV
jgi:hypothetical protein